VAGSLGWCWQTDLTSPQPEFFLWTTKPAATFCCGVSIPPAMSMVSTGPFDLTMCFPINPFLDPKGLVPPKWTGRFRVTAFMAADQAYIWPCSDCLAASCHVRAHRLAVVPWVRACPFVVAPRGIRVCTCVTAPLGCARPSAAAPQVVAWRLCACPLAAASRLCVWPCLAVSRHIRARPPVAAPRCILRSRPFLTVSRLSSWPHLVVALP